VSVAGAVAHLGAEALEPLRLAVEALSGLQVEIILATTADQLALLPKLSDNVRPVISLPLMLVLPYCAAIVHQAGDGSTYTAAALGVPQLVVTRRPECVLTGERLTAVGAGINLPYQDLAADPTPLETVRSAAGKLLAGAAYAEAALKLQEVIQRQPSPAELVPVLEALKEQR
jgi:glycosyltransferase